MKIVVADDDPVFLHLVTAKLKSVGFYPITASDAIQAFIAIQRHVPSAVVLDMKMPGGSAEAVLNSMKRSTKTQHIPVIVVSASTDAKTAELSRRLGADAFLPKPVCMQHLSDELLRLVGLGTEGSELTNKVGSEIKVLVADDDILSRRLLQRALSGWDFRIVTAEDGSSAWQSLDSSDPPHIAILDWMMPGMDGLELCRRLRQHPRETYTYVILLTGKGAKEDLVRGLDAGADDYIVKPFHAGELRVRLAAGRRIVELQEDLLNARAALHHRSLPRFSEPVLH